MIVPARRIAFYAPLKSPDHPVASGDRLMARQLRAALDRAGYRVELVSDLRAYLRDPEDAEAFARLSEDAAQERARLAAAWAKDPPDVFFCYHPYYKAPDLIGPALARDFCMPYVTCEASYSSRRNLGVWAETQAGTLATLRSAALNICLTGRDRAGLAAVDVPNLAQLIPFIATDAFAAPPQPQDGHIVTVAMMRPGDKLDSYRAMALALGHLPPDLHWHLSVAGDGAARADVQALFAHLPADRIDWLGALGAPAVAALLTRGAVYLWPGCNEAYGLAYLEAQAAGLPVVAYRTAGVPDVVSSDIGGALVADGDPVALAGALAALLDDPARAASEGAAVRQHVMTQHSDTAAAARLSALIEGLFKERIPA
ncbi:glycosyltransferase family 4 protein [Loktanella sp. M215]|uniref:glycosyltransferase family 4 protein n=1 Tax=Loktanella sp. M215 TaxID=2675431 RepID=UPI001F265DBB|nr:glycosyltransferase family 4 protein [Loktanella sp. M215]MCF7698688.1 glycosyltransferase [Loktanella sp. M215]